MCIKIYDNYECNYIVELRKCCMFFKNDVSKTDECDYAKGNGDYLYKYIYNCTSKEAQVFYEMTR